MDLLAPIKVVDRFQQKRPWLAVLFATIKKFGDDSGGSLAALVAYYAFFSLFPLLLVFVTILGYVLAGDQSLMHSVSGSVLGRFPVIGTSINTGKLHGSAPALIIGILLSLYSGLGVTQSAENAFNTIWEVPKRDRPDFFMSKLRGVLLLTILGAMFIVASGASGVVSGGLGGTGAYVLGVVVSLLLNFCLFMVSFKVLCSADLDWHCLIPGSIAAAILWTILQLAGGAYIGHLKHSSYAYGTFALVLGVMAWLHLGAQATMYCASFNVVLTRKQWPRSLFGADNLVVPRRDGKDERVIQEALGASTGAGEVPPLGPADADDQGSPADTDDQRPVTSSG